MPKQLETDAGIHPNNKGMLTLLKIKISQQQQQQQQQQQKVLLELNVLNSKKKNLVISDEVVGVYPHHKVSICIYYRFGIQGGAKCESRSFFVHFCVKGTLLTAEPTVANRQCLY